MGKPLDVVDKVKRTENCKYKYRPSLWYKYINIFLHKNGKHELLQNNLLLWSLYRQILFLVFIPLHVSTCKLTRIQSDH